MAWYWIVAIVLAGIFALLFTVYMTNADLKLVQKVYDGLLKYHDDRDIESKL